VFVDVEPDFYNLDVGRLESAITDRTKAVVAVHLLGQPAQIDAIKSLCDERGIHLVEDCAQARFAELNGQQVGTFGIAGTFSFYPGKNLGAYGDAGAIVTNNDDFADQMRAFARHGASPSNKHDHIMEGVNSRMDGIQAAVLNVKLPHIASWNSARQLKAQLYTDLLGNLSQLQTTQIRPGAKHVFHAYVIRVPNRDALRAELRKSGIGTAIHYPKPLPLLQAYARLCHRAEQFPVAVRNSGQFLTLPLYPELPDEEIRRICDVIASTLTP
jgi:dTDP-4-amino-4,6-dideoxygalactose transaminase